MVISHTLTQKWVECSPIVRDTGVQFQVASYQRLLKWYLIPPCLTLSIIRYVSREKWSNPGKELRPPLHFCVVAIEKGAFWLLSTTVTNFTYYFFSYQQNLYEPFLLSKSATQTDELAALDKRTRCLASDPFPP